MAPYDFVKHKIYKGTPNTQVVNEFKQSETDELSQRFIASWWVAKLEINLKIVSIFCYLRTYYFKMKSEFKISSYIDSATLARIQARIRQNNNFQ